MTRKTKGALISQIRDKESDEVFRILDDICKYLAEVVDEKMSKNNNSQISWIEFLGKERISINKPDYNFLKRECNENLFEIINQVRHVWVIMAVLKYFQNKKIIVCHPTQTSQSSKEKSSKKEADLEGDDFAVEAYGGIDIGNNGKLGKSIQSLFENKRQHKYLAFFTECDLPDYFTDLVKDESSGKMETITYKGDDYNVTYKGSETIKEKGIPFVQIIKLEIDLKQKNPQTPSKA